MVNFTVSHVEEVVFRSYAHSIGIVSFMLNLYVCHLIVNRTPRSSLHYKRYLLFLQCWTTISDVHLSLAFVPVPLYPLIGAYTLGIGSSLGLFSPHDMAVAIQFIVGMVTSSTILCFLFRHQTIMPEGCRWKLGKITQILMNLMLCIFFVLPGIATIPLGMDKKTAEAFIREKHPGMSWILNRGYDFVMYDATDTSAGTLLVVGLVMMVAIISLTLLVFMTSHIFYSLSSMNFMSERTRQFHRRMTMSLITQTSVLFAFLLVPFFVYEYVIIMEMEIHELVLLCTALTFTHSFAHSITIIMTTPSYKRSLLHLIKAHSFSYMSAETTATVRVKEQRSLTAEV